MQDPPRAPRPSHRRPSSTRSQTQASMGWVSSARAYTATTRGRHHDPHYIHRRYGVDHPVLCGGTTGLGRCRAAVARAAAPAPVGWSWHAATHRRRSGRTAAAVTTRARSATGPTRPFDLRRRRPALDDPVHEIVIPEGAAAALRELLLLGPDCERLCSGSAPTTTARSSPGGTEAINGLIELHRRIARGFRNRDNYRLRMLLIGGGLDQVIPT
jgi:hypothetical protein